VTRPYTPRRAAKRWLEGAPEYVLDVFDHGPGTYDRYDVYFGGSLLDDSLLKLREVHYLAMSASPTHPHGFSQCGCVRASYRPSHHRIRWLDLPENIRQHVAARVKE
jgi:hypothetical protein